MTSSPIVQFESKLENQKKIEVLNSEKISQIKEEVLKGSRIESITCLYFVFHFLQLKNLNSNEKAQIELADQLKEIAKALNSLTSCSKGLENGISLRKDFISLLQETLESQKKELSQTQQKFQVKNLTIQITLLFLSN